MALSPGTVSKILWHFTGGPRWNSEARQQESDPKPREDAYAALLSILNSKELRVGSCQEVVKVRVPVRRRFDSTANRMVEELDSLITLISAPVCCVADIPIAHLAYHAERYGKVAVGFHREAVLKAGFNPVFYTLHDTSVLQNLYQGLAQLEDVDVDSLESVADELGEAECGYGHQVDVSSSHALYEVRIGADMIKDGVKQAMANFDEVLAFVKSFERNEFQTIYCEREWRSISAFGFSYSDVAMIVLPKQDGDYFSRFSSEDSVTLSVPRSLPIVPWEDLVEH